MSKPELLIVDDDSDLRTQMRLALADDYEIREAQDRPSAIACLEQYRPPLITLDLGLPPTPNDVGEGFALLREIVSRQPGVKIIVVTGQDTRRHALSAIAQSAYDFFPKPIALEELRVVLKRALHVYRLEREHQELQRRLDVESFEGLLGSSAAVEEVFSAVRRVATTDAPVLLGGESGTGKELVARAIHRLSSRREGPFVAINCGAIPENLLESELFGHEKGAFTGAHVQRAGRIELAHRGTLLLDEIGELPASLQVKLLRFLQDHRIERLGARKEIEVDVRILAATNVDLKQAMSAGRFREDLYYRLAVVSITLPPLRDRGEDVLLLARAFVHRFSTELGKPVPGLSPEAVETLRAHRWPGNVRELENRLQRAVIMAEGRVITAQDMELGSPETLAPVGLREAREAFERDLIRRALKRNGGNVTQAAAELGIGRATLYELLDKLGIRRDG